MSGQPIASTKITLVLPVGLHHQLVEIARGAETTEPELIRLAIEDLVQARRGPAVPRFARRLGPIAISNDGPSAA